MEEIRLYAEQLIGLTGFSGSLMRIGADVLLILITLLLAWVAYLISYRVLMPIVVKIATKTSATWDDTILNQATLKAGCKIVPAIVIWLFIPHIFYRHPGFEEFLVRLTAIYITILSTKFGLTFADSFKTLSDDNASAKQQYLHTFCGVLRIVIIFVSIIVVVAIAIGKSPATLFAGLGATSAVLMLVFKDTIAGLVAGVKLTSNEMLQKGDWITMDKAGINGIVEDISMTTIKVRNFDNTIVTVAPQTLVDDSFQNWKGMQKGDGRRATRTIYFDFRSIRLLDERAKARLVEKGLVAEADGRRRSHGRPSLQEGDVVNLTLFRRHVELKLSQSDDVNTEMPFLVRQFEPTNAGLPVQLYFFLKEKTWKPYEHQIAELMEYVYAIVPEFGLTIYQRL